jgi:hypothetical protein
LLPVALTWWRGELRAQRLISQRRSVAVVQVAIPVVVVPVLVIAIRGMISNGRVPVTNVALLTVDLLVLVFSGTLVNSEESQSRVQDLRAWAAPRPVTSSELTRFTVLTGLLRGALYTGLLCCAAVGALLAPQTLAARAEIVCAAVLFPLPSVTAALVAGARRSRPLGAGFITVPFGLVILGSSTRLPTASGAVGGVVRAIAAPGLTLLGREPPVTGAVVLAAWLACSLWLLSRLGGALRVTVAERRPRTAARLAGGRGRRLLVLDLVTYRLSAGAVAEVMALVVLLAALAGFVAASGPRGAPVAGAITVAGLSWPTVSAGYRHLAAVTAMPEDAARWLRTLPLPPRALPWARHVVCACGALVTSAVFTGIELALHAAGIPVTLPAVVAAAAAPLTLTGWMAIALSWNGIARVLGYAALAWYVVLRAATVAVVSAVHFPPAVLASLLAVDLLVGALGHLLARFLVRTT